MPPKESPQIPLSPNLRSDRHSNIFLYSSINYSGKFALPLNNHLTILVYHSSFVDEEGITKACGCPLLPLKSHIKGPAPVSNQDRTDIVDEAITFFRANVFFRNFDIKSSADKLLIYLTFYINVALKRLEGCRTLAEGTKAIINLGLEDVPVPGESGFPFPGLFALPQSRKESELFRNYLKQIRRKQVGDS
ncbi:Actin-related protein 2/3 complex subunit 3 [Camellia lanceoleosa]|uniref:Actin-related protein 2/3 complex subunit 3 n=1 Tax=Camellia lanceoleosa TaxID=1840588 RepID=A0ACC0FK89_9ERIC|nr:Actin-related protein 2/3 complex subunit 3 [Camellia lanceoleosa]